MRLFVAIEVPESERHRLAEWRARQHWFEREAPALKWVDTANLHLTLKFLGEVPDADVPEVCVALKGVERREAFSLRIEGLACLPPRGRIGVIVAEMAGDLDRLIALQMDIERALTAIGFARETRTFRPHVTIARRRGGGAVSGLLRKLVADRPGPSGEPFLVESYVLMSSSLKPTGSVYTPVASFSLSRK